MKTALTCLLIFASIRCMSSGNDNRAQDISSNDIYDFMKVVIKDQKLNLKLALDTDPPSYCNSSGDSTYLYTLLIDPSPAQTRITDSVKTDTFRIDHSKDSFYFTLAKGQTYFIGRLEPCLTKEDINYMLEQRSKLASFKWDKARSGFSKEKTKNWYSISVPLFSKDKTKAILMIEELCPGLCGSGYTILYTRKDGKWTSQKSGTWYH